MATELKEQRLPSLRHEKLIRDGIAEKILRNPDEAHLVRRCKDVRERRRRAVLKVREESLELAFADVEEDLQKIIEEAGDLLAAFQYFLKQRNILWSAVEEAERIKAEEKGGFAGGYLLTILPN